MNLLILDGFIKGNFGKGTAYVGSDGLRQGLWSTNQRLGWNLCLGLMAVPLLYTHFSKPQRVQE
jgi:hypothetical protein